MEFLKIRRGTGQKRANGSGYAVPLFVTKTQRMGNTISEEAISTKRPILVTGAHDSGKSKWVDRLYENAAEIWGTKSKTAPLYLHTLRPLVAWSDEPDVEKWWEGKRLEEEKTDLDNARAPWKALKQYQRHQSGAVHRRCAQARRPQAANCAAMRACLAGFCDRCQRRTTPATQPAHGGDAP